MGDPKKPKKKYTTPMHPWQSERIEEEKKLKREYGLKNNREIWKMKTILRSFYAQVKKSIAATGSQTEKETELLLAKLARLGLIKKTAKLDEVLGLTIHSLMDRRLQTLVYKKGYARTQKQARQFILHGHVTVNGKKLTSPSHLVTVDEEERIGFKPTSSLADAEHPERVPKKANPKSAAREQRQAERQQRGPPRGRREGRR